MTQPYVSMRFCLDYLQDTAVFALAADAAKDMREQRRMARASLLFGFLYIESVANACIEQIELKGKFGDEVDSLPALSKLELFLRCTKPRAKLDRGHSAVQRVAELKQFRDRLVHSKPTRVPLKPLGVAHVANPRPSQLLGIDQDLGNWSGKDAAAALRTVVDFSDYFFLELCKFSQREAFVLLHPQPRMSPPFKLATGHHVLYWPELFLVRKKWGVRIHFLASSAGRSRRSWRAA